MLDRALSESTPSIRNADGHTNDAQTKEMITAMGDALGKDGRIATDRIRLALTSNPTLALLKAYSRDWALLLFAEHLEQVEGSVAAEWFHERVAENVFEILSAWLVDLAGGFGQSVAAGACAAVSVGSD